MTSLTTPIQYLKGVGPYIAGLLDKRGVTTVADLLYYFPSRYIDRRQVDPIRKLVPGKDKQVIAEVVGSGSRPLGRTRRRLFEVVVSDGTGVALLVFFHFKESYLKKLYPKGKKLFISGECQMYAANKQFVHPTIEVWEDDDQSATQLILPIYPLTEGLYQKTIYKIISHALDGYLDFLSEDDLSVRKTGRKPLALKQAVYHVHRPPADAVIEELNDHKTVWHQRVIYDELFYLQLGLGLRKRGYQKEPGVCLKANGSLVAQAKKQLPFDLTNAQEQVLQTIFQDLVKDEPMNRLLQGDVGCGKTMVAFLAGLYVHEAQFQTVLMVPTEVLAKQHFLNLSPLATSLDMRLELLTGSTPKAKRDEILQDLKHNKISFIIGTHALIQDDVFFKKLGLIIIDEQHRFGVLQRAALKKKGGQNAVPHILSMTATPIPRSLSMSLYGDLDVSVIDELPKGRQPIKTYVFGESKRKKAYEFIRSELVKGRQVYFVYPLVEESDKLELKNAIAMSESLQNVFNDFKVGLVHGRMKAAEKDDIMAAFKQGDIHLLVSTTVIEVGVDVANASVMVIEHAERFGLSQLHQLRGRVGRGGHQAYCLLIASYARSDETRARLAIMEKTNDGFKIAEEDLNIRGPGDFLGTRQSGLPEFRLAHLVRDVKLLEAARRRAGQVIDEDPDLKLAEHQVMKQTLIERWEGKLELGRIA